MSQPKKQFFKPVRRDSDQPTQAETRRAKDFWTDVFQDAIQSQIDESSAGRAVAKEVVRFASEIASAALEEMEERWAKL